MTDVVLGTAHLFGLADAPTSERLLHDAWDLGVRRYDTAPLYGGGRSEPAVGALLADRRAAVRSLTTKVGLLPRTGPRSPVQLAGGVARRVLPAPVLGRARDVVGRALGRGTGAADGTGPTGRFAPDAVRASVEESLRRLGGRVDRLLLHEVSPGDVDDELLGALRRLVDAGDVGAVGVATQNHLTRPALDRGAGLLTVAHVAVGPLSPPVDVPPGVLVVGHGLLGGGGSHLAALREALAGPGAGTAWDTAVAGTPFAGPDGLPAALLARGAALGLAEVLVATTRPARLARTVALARGEEPLPPAALAVLEHVARGLPAPRG